jgi:protein SCO1/2
MTRIFAEVQESLGDDRPRVRLVSVSIDPEQDTPRRLRDYARQFGATEPWLFLTGSAAASTAVQKAFNSYRPDKMSHTPVSFLRRAPGQAWVRLDGLAQAGDILRELRPMLPPRP